MASSHYHSVFGLRVRSDVPLPELVGSEPCSNPDVIVRLGGIPGRTDVPQGVRPHEGGVLLVVDNVARYWIANGSEIAVEPAAGAPDRNVRLYLLGSVLGLLVHQRGLLPLHANAVEVGSRAFAFMGASGAGKSTLAAWFHDGGHRIIADDVCVVRFADDGRPQVCPGVARLRLWREALDATGRDVAAYPRSFLGEDSPDKYDVALTARGASDTPVALAAVYLLEKSDSLRIEPLTGVAAAEAVFANTYRGTYIRMAGSSHDHWSACVQLVRNTPIFRAGRRWGLDELAGQYAGLLEHAERAAQA